MPKKKDDQIEETEIEQVEETDATVEETGTPEETSAPVSKPIITLPGNSEPLED